MLNYPTLIRSQLMKCLFFTQIFSLKNKVIIIDERKGKQLTLREFRNIYSELLVAVKMLLKLTRISDKSSNTYKTGTFPWRFMLTYEHRIARKVVTYVVLFRCSCVGIHIIYMLKNVLNQDQC